MTSSGDTAAEPALEGGPSFGAPHIVIEGLSKVYETKGGPVHALKEVDLTVRKGEFVALVGPSGCGKSTLLHIVAGLVSHETGEVAVGGAPAKPGRRDLGIMLQKPVLLPWRTLMANVMLPVEILKLDRAEAEARAVSLLETVGLADFHDKYTWELSGGMRQRASLVQALVADPELLLMDEPFSAVDEFTRDRLNLEVRKLHETLNRTTLYVTHNITEAVFLADRVVSMRPRPGEVLEVHDIPLPRPRTAGLLETEEAGRLVAQIRHTLATVETEA